MPPPMVAEGQNAKCPNPPVISALSLIRMQSSVIAKAAIAYRCRSSRLVGDAFRLRRSLLSRARRSTMVLYVARQLLPRDGNSHPFLPVIAGRGERHTHGRLCFLLTIVRANHPTHHAEHCEHIEERADRTTTVIAAIAARQQTLSQRSPDERSDIRGFSFALIPAYRCAHADNLPKAQVRIAQAHHVIARSDLSAVAQRAKAEATKQSMLPVRRDGLLRGACHLYASALALVGSRASRGPVGSQ
jgi:hypothetical protein